MSPSSSPQCKRPALMKATPHSGVDIYSPPLTTFNPPTADPRLFKKKKTTIPPPPDYELALMIHSKLSMMADSAHHSISRILAHALLHDKISLEISLWKAQYGRDLDYEDQEDLRWYEDIVARGGEGWEGGFDQEEIVYTESVEYNTPVERMNRKRSNEEVMDEDLFSHGSVENYTTDEGSVSDTEKERDLADLSPSEARRAEYAQRMEYARSMEEVREVTQAERAQYAQRQRGGRVEYAQYGNDTRRNDKCGPNFMRIEMLCM